MNINKVNYWNGLRLLLNTYLFIFGGLTLLVAGIVSHPIYLVSLFSSSENFSLVISTLISLLIYIGGINFFLLLLETLDRMIGFKERKRLKKYTKFTLLILFSIPIFFNLMIFILTLVTD